MKLIIDISKDRYDEIMSMDWKNCRLIFDEELRAIHDGKALEQEPCEMTAEEYRQRMIQAFHNADYDELIALVVLPTEKEFEHLGWLLEKHYKAKPEPCDDEYIKVPKKALRYRTAGMVAYNVECLKNHFDIERAVICGEQEPCTDVISRQAVMDALCNDCELFRNGEQACFTKCEEFHFLATLPPVTPAEKPNKWIPVSERYPEDGQRVLIDYCDEDAGIMLIRFNVNGYHGFKAWMPLPESYKQEVKE